jgi:hypothetical protein
VVRNADDGDVSSYRANAHGVVPNIHRSSVVDDHLPNLVDADAAIQDRGIQRGLDVRRIIFVWPNSKVADSRKEVYRPLVKFLSTLSRET